MNEFDNIANEKLPVRFKPLSPWAYFGWTLLYSLPIIGWILVIVNAVGANNINCKNYARSYLVIWAILIIAIVVFCVFGGAALIASTFDNFSI